MCRSKGEGARRCNGKNPYGCQRRNLQAKKQYYTKKLEQNNLPVEQQKKARTALAATVNEMKALTAEKDQLGKVRSHVMNLTSNTEKVLDQLEADGFRPFLVGGSVRDSLLGADSKDMDIEVYGGSANDIIKSLRKIGQVDEVGKAFGVLKICIDSEDFDVSLPRLDSKVGDGHKGVAVEVNPDLSYSQATARRDYTINALMYHHRLGFIVDHHGGVEDLHNNTLRHVSDAYDEDPLRVLRGIQMASRFGMELHPTTIKKAQTLKKEYKHLAVERVQMEFQKLYEKGKTTHTALKMLSVTGWEENFPGLTSVNTPELRKQVQRAQNMINSGKIPKSKQSVIMSAVISHGMPLADRKAFLSETTVGSDTKNNALHLTEMKLPQKQGKASLRAWAYNLPRKTSIRDWSYLQTALGNGKKAKEVMKKAEKLGIADSPSPDLITGNDLLELFPDRQPGPWMKVALADLRTAQYGDAFTNKTSGVAWAAKNLK